MTTPAATTEIFYPETDGMPLPDGLTQSPIYAQIMNILMTFFKDLADCEVNGDVFIYYVEGDNRRTVSPDCFVAFGLSEAALESLERRNTYLLWEVGKPPDFVLEIGSDSTATVDTGRKRDLYAGWAFRSTGATTPRAGTTTERRWWASGWWTASASASSCVMRARGMYGRTATP